MLELMIERLRRVKKADAIIVATTVDPSCDPIEELSKRLGVICFRGSEEDVLDRVLQAANRAKADLIVETTADCPLIDPDVVDRVIEDFLMGGADYVANILPATWPNGMDVQVFPSAVLNRVAQLTNDPADREHVSLYIYEHPETFRLRNVESGLSSDVADWRLTVDTLEDFDLVTYIYQALYPKKPAFDLADMAELFRRRPDLLNLNRHIVRKPVR